MTKPIEQGNVPAGPRTPKRGLLRIVCSLLAAILLLAACGSTATPSTTASATAAAVSAEASTTTSSEASTEASSAAESPEASAEASSDASTESSAEASAASSEASAEASAAASPSAETSAAATAAAPAETSAAGSTTTDATAAIVAAANAFLETLSDTERESVLFDWTATEQKQRWSNLPEGLFERAGLMWGIITEEQQNAWLSLMQATLSEEGYNRVQAEWSADDALASSEGGGGGPGGQLLYGRDYYWVAIIGTPSETDAWQWQWGGHHVTVNATVVGPNVAVTPSFIGVQPGSYTDANGTTVRPLGDINDEAFALVNSLDATQQGSAILGDTAIDLVLGPGEEGRTIESEGLPASEMTEEQQAAFLQLIGHYTGLVNDEDAAARLAEIQSTLDETYFAWYGPTTDGSGAYFRVTGPTIVIEYSAQGAGQGGTGLGGEASLDHIHGIYRDPTNDYGAQYTQ